MYLRIASEFAEDRMPPYDAGIELSRNEIELIGRWIEEGADWPEGVEEADPRPALRAAGLPPVELPERPFIINTHEISEVRVRVLTRGLSHPWSMAFLPKGDILITTVNSTTSL